MNRFVTSIGIFVAALALILYFAHIGDFQFVLLAVSILLVGIGSLTGL